MGAFPAAAAPEAPVQNAEAATMTAAASALRGMTLEQKVGQLFVANVYGKTADTPHPKNREEFGVDTAAEVVKRYHLGGVIYFSWTDSFHNTRQVAELSNGLQRAAVSSGNLPLLVSTDQEQGVVTRFGPPATQFPGSMALGATRSTENARKAAEITGRELRAVGINQNFAPDADVNVNPANPVIGVRSFSSDPKLVSDMVTAQVQGYQGGLPTQGVSANVKHFPGHGDTDVDSHYGLPVINHTPEQWAQLDAPPFRAAIAKGVDSIMTAHIVVPKLDDSGEPSTLSSKVITGMLRGELGFRGVVYTDSLRMEGARKKHPDDRLPVLALKAGVDVLLMPQYLDVAIKSVINAVRTGELTEQRIDESVLRILLMKLKRGILTTPFVDPAAAEKTVGSKANQAAAQKVTDATVTAVRNDDKLLPMRTKPGKVLVTGWSDPAATWGTASTQTLAKQLSARGVATTALTTGLKPTPQAIDSAVAAAGQNDAVIVLTNRAAKEPTQQQLLTKLASTGKPVIAVAVRDPYDAAHVDAVKTWLNTYSFSAGSMESVAKVVLGELSPKGKLPVSVPSAGDPTVVRFPFGHGLTW
ncbi:glycoside hydrolase family 3 protein [Allokutzneria oryzae]|uniref:beta-N-acetylhexosaminidase n=1 Tax=Allokutzneria oryzae TaxID=1378989 RepID=A0ABV6A195_9PSEU